jgi:hypothetical protein
MSELVNSPDNALAENKERDELVAWCLDTPESDASELPITERERILAGPPVVVTC